MTSAEPSIIVAALYRFAGLADPAAMRARLAAFCCSRGIMGTLLLAPEGINGTVAGSGEVIEGLVRHLEQLPGLAGLDVKYSRASEMPFRRMKVRLKQEIVTMGVPGLDTAEAAGAYVEPADWNALIEDPATILIDTRNDYEVALGSFDGAIDPQTESFRDFPAWLAERRNAFEGRKVAMFCTGGIRCEKATAYARSLGLEAVYHLKGGILKYLEEVPVEESRWRGECFVFDERVSLGHGLKEGEAQLCRACGRPLPPEELTSPYYRPGVSCLRCVTEYSDKDRARFAERQRQFGRAQNRATGVNSALTKIA